jgi:hypothetical protein
MFKGYYDNQFNLIRNNNKIIKNYFFTYFFYDLISATPIFTLMIYYYLNSCFYYNINNNQKHILIIFSICFKLFKYIKASKNNAFMDYINDFFGMNYFSKKLFDNIKLIFNYFSILHLLACCHIIIGFNIYESWLFSIQTKYNINNYLSIYIAAFYYLITTLTTVGYGDIVCNSLTERIFQIIELSIGIVFYSYLITKIGEIVKNKNNAQMECENNLALLEDIRINYPSMPFKLYNKISHYLQSNIYKQKKNDTNLLINSLPHMLKSNLIFCIHKNYITHFNFFKKCYNSNFIEYTLQHFTSKSSKKNTILIKEDQLVDNVFFITEGR